MPAAISPTQAAGVARRRASTSGMEPSRLAIRLRNCGRLTALAATDGVEVLNDVRLNQVLVRFNDDDRYTETVQRRLQDSGECWTNGTTWPGRTAIRISIVNLRTSDDDIERTLNSIASAHRGAGKAAPSLPPG